MRGFITLLMLLTLFNINSPSQTMADKKVQTLQMYLDSTIIYLAKFVELEVEYSKLNNFKLTVNYSLMSERASEIHATAYHVMDLYEIYKLSSEWAVRWKCMNKISILCSMPKKQHQIFLDSIENIIENTKKENEKKSIRRFKEHYYVPFYTFLETIPEDVPIK